MLFAFFFPGMNDIIKVTETPWLLALFADMKLLGDDVQNLGFFPRIP